MHIQCHTATRKPPAIHSLHHGRARRPLVEVVPDDGTPLYRIAWPDIDPSPLVNLTRAKDAAREWAERRLAIEDRKSNAARRLKSLNNFWWSSSPVRKYEVAAPYLAEAAE